MWLDVPCVVQSMLDSSVVPGWDVVSSSSVYHMPNNGPAPMRFECLGSGVASGGVFGTRRTDSGGIELMRGRGSVGDDGCSGCGLSTDAWGCWWSCGELDS